MPLLLGLLKEQDPDVLCLQEIKCQQHQLDSELFQDMGYNFMLKGQKTYNGVAILSKSPIELIADKLNISDHSESQESSSIESFQNTTQFRFNQKLKMNEGQTYEHVQKILTINNLSEHIQTRTDDSFAQKLQNQARFLKVVIDQVCIYNVYVPNGQLPYSTAYHNQLTFLQALEIDVKNELQGDSEQLIIIAGDFNVAPLNKDADSSLHSLSLCDVNMRKAWFKLLDCGFKDCLTQRTWWDYRYKGNLSAKIDNILCTRKSNIKVLLEYRFNTAGTPSDHAPLLCVL